MLISDRQEGRQADRQADRQALQAALVDHARVIFAALLGEKIMEIGIMEGEEERGNDRLYLGLTSVGKKWFGQAKEWLEEAEDSLLLLCEEEEMHESQQSSVSGIPGRTAGGVSQPPPLHCFQMCLWPDD